MKRKLFIIVFAAVMLFSLTACGASKNKGEKINWSDMYLGSVLPEPDFKEGKIIINSSDMLNVNFYDVSLSGYNDYISRCKDKGFTVDSGSDSLGYFAYNSDGYKLILSIFESHKELRIELDAPMELSEIEWPSGAAGKAVPVPKSLTGSVSYDRDDSFRVYIGNTSKDDYNEYVKTCSDAGFNIDYDKNDVRYSAESDSGFKLVICYEGNNIMSIDADPVKDKGGNKAETVKTETEPAAVTDAETENSDAGIDISGAVDPDFKAAMDAYEVFFDEYIEFMEKYQNADQAEALNMLADYTDFLQRYTETVNSLNEIDSGSLSPADYAYYTEVMLRINQKLASIQQ